MKSFLLSAIASLVFIALQPVLAMADKAMPAVTLSGHTDVVNALTFSPDGKRLASASYDQNLKVWDVDSKKELFTMQGVSTDKNTIRFSPDGKTIIALGGSNNLLVVDAESGKAKPSIPLPDLHGGPSAIDISPDGKSIAVVGNSTLRILDLATGNPSQAYEVHSLYRVSSVAYSPDGKYVATASDDHTSLVVEIATGKIPNTFNNELNGQNVLFSRDGKKVITYSSDQIVRSFDIASGDVQKLCDKGASDMTLSLSKDGTMLVLGGFGRAPWTLSLANGKLIDDAYDSSQFVRSAAISPDGKWIAGGANSGEIFLWNTGK